MRKLKVGDRVMCVSKHRPITIGMKGTLRIIHRAGTPKMGVEWDNFITGNSLCRNISNSAGYSVHPNEIKPLSCIQQ